MNTPKGWKLVPVELTAENGMKAALMGEFTVPLPDRDENGDEYIRQINVPWTVIKQIHRAIVAAAPIPPMSSYLTIEEQIAEAKENNPDLVHWENNDPEAWDEALKQDEILRNSSRWANRPFAERLAEVVRRVRAILTEASVPGQEIR